MNKKRIAVFTAILAFINLSIFAQFINVKKDANGWRLMDGRKEIEVKGIVWSYTLQLEKLILMIYGQRATNSLSA